MRLVIEGLEVRSGHASRERCETTVENAGGCVLAITTALVERCVVLNTCYLADFVSPPLAASYLLTAPSREPRVWQQTISEELVGTSLVRACLLDHVAALRACLEDLLGEAVTVSVPDGALQQVAQVWRSASHPRQ